MRSRWIFFSDASSAVYLSLFDLTRVLIYCSYCFYWKSMFSRFSESNFSTLPTRSFIAWCSIPRCLYYLSSLGFITAALLLGCCWPCPGVLLCPPGVSFLGVPRSSIKLDSSIQIWPLEAKLFKFMLVLLPKFASYNIKLSSN